MKWWQSSLGLAGLAGLTLLACAKNPLGSSAGSGPVNNGTSYMGVAEVVTADVLFSPNSSTEITAKSGAAIKYSWGGASKVDIPGFGSMGAGAPFTCPASAQSTVLDLRSPGIGGPDGTFNPATDYYLHFSGFKGPSSACDYNSLYMALKPGAYVDVDLTKYRGFIFFARGTGNWGVQIEGHGLKTGQSGPYADFNYYERVFGSELSPSTWKQITVNWADLQQLYGQHVDLQAALAKSTALQFVQEAPFTSNFTLELDYIRFF